MDVGEFLGLLRRQWLLLVIGIPAGLALAWSLAHPTPTYTVRSEVQFLRPSIVRVPNALTGGTASLTATAGLIARDVTSPTADPLTTTSDVDLPGLGVRHGSSVVLPNSGGQWAYNFASATLVVQSVGASPAEVRSLHEESLNQIQDALDRRQDAANVDEDQRIRLRAFPANPPVEVHDGHRTAALGLAAYACLVPLLPAAVIVDRLRSRRPRLIRRRAH